MHSLNLNFKHYNYNMILNEALIKRFPFLFREYFVKQSKGVSLEVKNS